MVLNAFEMIRKSKEVGADYVKFQIFKKEHIENHPQFEKLKEMILDFNTVKLLFDYGKENGIEIFFTPFFPEAIDWIEKIGVSLYKVRFSDQNNYQLYKRLKKTRKTILVSCQDPKDTLYLNLSNYQKNVRFLYCVPKYPAKDKDYNPLSTDFHGISDHTPNLSLYQNSKDRFEWFEKHVKLNDACIESNWSVSFDELKEVLK